MNEADFRSEVLRLAPVVCPPVEELTPAQVSAARRVVDLLRKSGHPVDRPGLMKSANLPLEVFAVAVESLVRSGVVVVAKRFYSLSDSSAALVHAPTVSEWSDRVMAIIHDAGAEGIVRSALVRKCFFLGAADRNEILKKLIRDGQVVEIFGCSTGGRRPLVYKVAAEMNRIIAAHEKATGERTPPINAGLDRLDPERAPGHPEMVPVPPPRGAVE